MGSRPLGISSPPWRSYFHFTNYRSLFFKTPFKRDKIPPCELSGNALEEKEATRDERCIFCWMECMLFIVAIRMSKRDSKSKQVHDEKRSEKKEKKARKHVGWATNKKFKTTSVVWVITWNCLTLLGRPFDWEKHCSIFAQRLIWNRIVSLMTLLYQNHSKVLSPYDDVAILLLKLLSHPWWSCEDQDVLLFMFDQKNFHIPLGQRNFPSSSYQWYHLCANIPHAPFQSDCLTVNCSAIFITFAADVFFSSLKTKTRNAIKHSRLIIRNNWISICFSYIIILYFMYCLKIVAKKILWEKKQLFCNFQPLK